MAVLYQVQVSTISRTASISKDWLSITMKCLVAIQVDLVRLTGTGSWSPSWRVPLNPPSALW